MESQLLDKHVSQIEVACDPLRFTLGRDHDGLWIVQEAHGLCGGLFISENAATRYAKFESAGRGSVIRVIPDPDRIELLDLRADLATRAIRQMHCGAETTAVQISEN